MKPVDFFCQFTLKIRPILIGTFSCFVLTAHAEPPPLDAFTQSNDLVLTLSDEWLNTEAPQKLERAQGKSDAPLLNRESQKRSDHLGCGMDISDYDSADNSLASRMVGKCNLNLRY